MVYMTIKGSFDFNLVDCFLFKFFRIFHMMKVVDYKLFIFSNNSQSKAKKLSATTNWQKFIAFFIKTNNAERIGS